MGEQVVELGGALAHQMGEHLALLLAGQIGARGGGGQIELRGIARVLGHGILERRRIADADRIARAAAPVKSLSRDARSLSARCPQRRRRAQRLRPRGIVDDDGAHQHVVQQPPAVVEEGDQQDERREERDGDPVDDRVHRAEHEIGGRAVPGAHLQIHDPHPDGGRGRAAEGVPVVADRPDHRRGREQPVQRPADPERDHAEDEDEHRREHDRDGEDGHVDEEGDEPARQHPFEQFRIDRRVVGMGLDVDRHADPPRVRHQRYLRRPSLLSLLRRQMENRPSGRKRHGAFAPSGRAPPAGRRSGMSVR